MDTRVNTFFKKSLFFYQICYNYIDKYILCILIWRTLGKWNIMDDKAVLREQNEEIKNLLAAVPGGVFKYEAIPRGQFAFVSAQLLRLLGYTEQEFRQKFNNCFDDMVYVEDRDKVLKSIENQIENGEFDTCEYRIEMKNGDLRWFYDVGHLVTDETGKRWFYVVVVDIDDRRRLQEERENKARLMSMLEAAQDASRAKTLFLSNVSHDMRTPLNGVIGYTELALASQNLVDMRYYLSKINDSSHMLMKLIQDTLDLSRFETGTYTLNLAPVYCGEVVDSLLTAIKPQAEAKGIKITVDNSKAVMANINIDSSRVQEIILNLLSNAIKFTPKGGHVELIIECLKETPRMIYDKIVVKDNGRGISPQFLPHIFEAFAQERHWDEENVGGTGLGLSIVKRLIDLMGGRIEVESELDKGSTFTVYLNFERANEKTKQTTKNAIDGEVLTCLQDKRILLFEDNALNSEIVVRLLERRGVKVTVATNGKIGLEIFEKSDLDYFSAIIMDVRMPVMGGLEATKALRALERRDAKTIPIIAMSANAYPDDIANAHAAGMNDYLTKPVVPGVMFRTLAMWLKQ